jgi:signal transduction histidine kinase/DNA-binding response OmpR family regulator
VIVVDRTGTFYYANGAAFNMLGAVAQFDSYADTLKSVDFYHYPSGELYPLEQRPTYQALQGKAAQADDLQMYLNGRPVQISSSSSPVYSANGDLQYVVTSIIDITDRVQSQERLREAKEMAETTAKLKENFLANMSHEIRTPLNAMLGFSDLLGTTVLDSEQKEFLGSIQTAGKNLLTIVNDILDISKIEAGMIKLESIPFSIHLLASSIKTMFQATAADKDLQLVVTTDSSLPPVLLGDPTRLTQILLNLLSNAIKFTKRGGVTMQISKCEQTAESVRLRFAVVDTGIGIEAHVLPTIFERFQQANDFTTRFYGGTGLGLNIVKSLTELQGGSISVDSTIGVGSTFTVEITYSIGAEEVNSLADQTPADRMVADQPVHVLVAEDNVMNQKLVTQVLKRLGCQVEVADNGEHAIRKLQDAAYDIILMDIQMPIMDGYETTQYIRSKLNNSIPIIAMTAHALASEREECLKAGMNDFLSKPFRMEELQRLLRKYLRSKSSIKETVTQDKSMIQPSATFSSESLMNSVGNDMELAIEILELYLTQTPIELEKLQQALDQRDIDAVSRLIHMYKAHTRMLGLDEATRLIVEAEELVKNGKDVADVWPLIEQYIKEIKSVLPTISVYLETTAGRTA